MEKRRTIFALVGLFSILAFGICTPLLASDKHIAIKGYDPVAYFTDSKPKKGNTQFTYEWDGAVYQFASAKHLELFKAEPEKYAPLYRGFCTVALARGIRFVADPENWLILDGQLHIFGGPLDPNLARKDLVSMKKKADENYKRMSELPTAKPAQTKR